VRRAIEAVAKRLGNTTAVCRKCYIHPEVVHAYLDGTLAAALNRRAGSELRSNVRTLSTEEAAVLALLQRGLEQDARLAAA
jgi:DNA topoisomerase-1